MSETNNEKSRIEIIKKDLYSRNPRMGLTAQDPKYDPEPDYTASEVRSDWDTNTEKMEEERIKYKLMQMKKSSPLKKIFITSFVFFLAAASYAGYTFYFGANEISSDRVDISVTGPASVRGGDELPIEILVRNQNNAHMEAVRLEVTYPDGARSVEKADKQLVRESFQLGTIVAGGETTKKISALIFGETNTFKKFSFVIEYRVEGSNGLFTKKKDYEIFINSSPVSISVESIKETVSNKEFEISVAVVSESVTALSDLAVNADYGLGFTFLGSTPMPLSAEKTWYIGSLSPGGRKVIKVRGKLSGQDGEERFFGFSVGTTNDKDSARISVPMQSVSQKVVIRRPFVAADLALNGQASGDLLAKSGAPINGEITLTNNLSERLADVSIELSLRGDSLDPSTVKVKKGIFDASAKKIVWQARGEPMLAVVVAGDQIVLPFTFSTYKSATMANMGLKNQEIAFDIIIRAKRFSEDRVPEEVTTEISRKVKVETDFTGEIIISRNNSPYQNTGPIPPRVDQETTYNVVWRISNSMNNVTNATVVAVIPQYVKWISKFEPSQEDVSLNEITGELTWKVGEVVPGTGFSTSARELNFQVVLKPGLNLLSSVPTVIGPAVFKGVDRFTGQAVSDTAKAVTTRIEAEELTGFKAEVAK